MGETPVASSTLTGRTLSHYKIEERIGEGGMGVVYRALDTVLGRPVAIKILPERCAGDPERRARFEREAKLLAALDHSNIGGIHGLETSGDLCFLVLELIPGDTLDRKLANDPPHLKEALHIARQVAEGLEAAHEKGIVHRDLKPANVKITPEGEVKVLDFGLAKALQTESSASGETLPTATVDQTAAGVIVGTAAYMSPEQARGLKVDKRTDIWAFGCILYELLAHRRVFFGETISDYLAAILKQEPDWTALPDSVPENVRTLLRRCLEKDPRKRLRDVGDARLELEEPAPARVQAAAPKSRLAAFALAGVAAGAVLAAAVLTLVRPSASSPAVTRFSIPLAAGEVVAPVGSSVRLSADGTQLAWVAYNAAGRTQIYRRRLDRLQASALEGTASGYTPSFSPDGAWLAFLHAGSRTLKKVGLSGGAPSTVCPFESTTCELWGPGDEIFLNTQHPGALLKVAASGGDPKPVSVLDKKREELVHRGSVVLPGGKAVLLSITGRGMETWDDARIAVQSLDTGERKTLIEGGMAPSYSPTGHLVYAREGKLLAVPFDVKRLAVTGSPVPVLDGLFMCVNTGSAHYSLANNGTLAYAAGVVLGGERKLVWVDREGNVQPLATPARAWLHPRISPDGKRLVVEIEGFPHDFWSYDFERGVLSKVTTEGSHWPLWTPDGSRITYRRWINGAFTMWWMAADRSTPPERLTDIGRMQSAASWSPDSRVVAFTQVSFDTGADIFVLDMTGERKPRAFVQTRFDEGSPRFSPDGRWIAYASNESGRNEIYVQAYPGPGAKIQVSTDGGTDAVWRPKGGELYYRDGDKMMAVQVSTSGAFQASRPKLLWTGRYAHGLGSQCGPPGTTSSNYDVSADGQRFLMIQHDETAPAQINVVLNWTEELKRILETKRL